MAGGVGPSAVGIGVRRPPVAPPPRRHPQARTRRSRSRRASRDAAWSGRGDAPPDDGAECGVNETMVTVTGNVAGDVISRRVGTNAEHLLVTFRVASRGSTATGSPPR